MNAAPALIRIERLEKTYPGQALPALQAVDLDVGQGEFLALVGASGCGKSTLLRLMAGLESPTHGRIRLDGAPVTGPGPDRAVVFQDYSLYPWLTVLENVRFCRRLRVHTGEASESQAASAVERAYALLDVMGLDGVRNHYPNQLSGGMRQRVAIARALLADNGLLLLDDALSAVDTGTETRILQHLEELRRKRPERSAIIASHRLSAVVNADLILVLRDGHVTETGSHDALMQRDGWYASQWRYQQLEASLDAI